MRTLLLLTLMACAATSQQKLAETPTATTRRPPPVAPPASDNDKDRYQMDQQFQDMHDAQQAHREAGRTDAPTGGIPTAVPATTPAPAAKRGPAVQAPAAPAPVR